MSESSVPALPETGRQLHIFINRDRVGTLHEDNDLWTLVYDHTWASRDDSFDLSPSLPRSQLLHRDGATLRPVQWYFDNLLPEERLRELIAQDIGLKGPEDAFALLQYLGAESAGSLTLLPPGKQPDEQASLKALTFEELSQRISKLPHTTLTRQAPKRMSLAGAQHKMLVVLKGGLLYEPVGSTPSTHILKPDHPAKEDYPASTYLEWLTMRLAGAAGLDVPPVYLLHVPHPVYAIERFDRRFNPQELDPATEGTPPAVSRVHVIDACQLLNKSRLFKHSGASVQALRDIVDTCGNTVTLPVQLFRWLVFNLLVANDDCHLKNLSFVVAPGQVNLAPHYDLLATGAYHTRMVAGERGAWPGVPLAVSLSNQVTHFHQVTRESVLEAAEVLGVPRRVADRTIRVLVERVAHMFDAVYAEYFPDEEGLFDQLRSTGLTALSRPHGPGLSALPERGGVQIHESGSERAQQLMLLRVLRHMVLPEMAKRLLL